MERLDSWKQIAAYLKRDIRTVQRWEKLEGLPVHRHQHLKRGSAFAYTGEIDQWWEGRGAELSTQPEPATPAEVPDSSGPSDALDAVEPIDTGDAPSARAVSDQELAGSGDHASSDAIGVHGVDGAHGATIRALGEPGGIGAALPTARAVASSFAVPLGTAALVFAILAAGFFFLTPTSAVRNQPTQRLQVLAPPDTRISIHPVISPDGRTVAFIGVDSSGAPHLWIRRLDNLDAHLVPGTEGAAWPFWSSDSRNIGFFAGGKLKRTDTDGHPPRVICDAPNGRGGTWSGDRIVFAPFISGPLHEVAAAGGTSHAVTTVDETAKETAHRWPQFLPDGRQFIFFVLGPPDVNGIYLATPAASAGTSIATPAHRRLIANNSSAVYAEGHLLFWQDGGLAAQRLDVTSGSLRGDVFRVTEAPNYAQAYSISPFAVSNTGTLIYQRPGSSANRLVWMDRTGHELGNLGPQTRGLTWLALSPDQQQVAIQRPGRDSQESAIWLGDLERGGWTRFMSGKLGGPSYPVWSPDGKRMAFALRDRHGLEAIFEKDTASGAAARLLVQQPTVLTPSDWSADGRMLLFNAVGREQKRQLATFSLDAAAASTRPFPATGFDEFSARFSPDMKWVAYVSNESDRFEVYVQPYPPTGQRVRVSSSGGFQPRWRRDGRELFFLSADRQMMAVPIATTPSLHIGTPRALFDAPVDNPAIAFASSYYDVSPDGQRFLLSRVTGADSDSIAVVLNWTGIMVE